MEPRKEPHQVKNIDMPLADNADIFKIYGNLDALSVHQAHAPQASHQPCTRNNSTDSGCVLDSGFVTESDGGSHDNVEVVIATICEEGENTSSSNSCHGDETVINENQSIGIPQEGAIHQQVESSPNPSRSVSFSNKDKEHHYYVTSESFDSNEDGSSYLVNGFHDNCDNNWCEDTSQTDNDIVTTTLSSKSKPSSNCDQSLTTNQCKSFRVTTQVVSSEPADSLDNSITMKCQNSLPFQFNPPTKVIPTVATRRTADPKRLDLNLISVTGSKSTPHTIPEEPTSWQQTQVKLTPIVKKTPSTKQSWLLRLFESKLFDMSIAITYLFNSKEPGVQTYIGKGFTATITVFAICVSTTVRNFFHNFISVILQFICSRKVKEK